MERLERVRSVAITVGKPIGVLADLPGPKVRAGAVPGAGCPARGGIGDPLRGRRWAERRRGDLRRLPRRSWKTSQSAIGWSSAMARSALRVERLEPTSAVAVVENGGRTQGCPGVHLPSERSRLTTPTDEDLVLAETMAAAGVEFIAVSFVRAPADMTAVREVVGDRAAVGRQDRDERGARQPHRDHRRVGRDHGRPGRPRHRLPARGRAPPPEVDRPAVCRVRRPGHHRDADAGDR